MSLNLHKVISFIAKESYKKELLAFSDEQEILHVSLSDKISVVKIPFFIRSGSYLAWNISQQLKLYHFLRSEGFKWRSEWINSTDSADSTLTAMKDVHSKLITLRAFNTLDRTLVYGRSLGCIIKSLVTM